MAGSVTALGWQLVTQRFWRSIARFGAEMLAKTKRPNYLEILAQVGKY
jgi:hypothetical protein